VGVDKIGIPPHLNPPPCLRPARRGYAQAGARGDEILVEFSI